jgi:hypothetical protein
MCFSLGLSGLLKGKKLEFKFLNKFSKKKNGTIHTKKICFLIDQKITSKPTKIICQI